MRKRKTQLDVELFTLDPCLFLEKAIKEYVATSPINCLTAFDNAPIFDEPIVAFASGDDPIFQDFRRVIGVQHLTPREALEKHIQTKQWNYGVKSHMEHVSVISYAMPETYETRLTTRHSPYGGSLRHNHTRWRGEVFQKSIQHYLVSLLEIMGYDAVAPRRAPFFEWANTPDGVMVNWSERHVAYASGLGTFGLNGLLITSKGCAHYLGSVVCDVVLTPTSRPYDHHMAYCLSHRYGKCRKCMERCVGGAINEQGRSIEKCRHYMRYVQPEKLKEMGAMEGLIGMAITCGLCWTGVPCEDRIPGPEALGK
jgi:epoxyqueuosine reductase QueG